MPTLPSRPRPRPRPRSPRAERIPVLLGTQLLFNVGFYAVVPFLALVLTDDFGLAAAAVGLVLGVRTFAQQGMFLVGGVFADRFGARGVILVGCAVRVAGFATLAVSLTTPDPTLALFVVGTVLTGLGGALFSPGLNVLIGAAESRRGTAARSRASLFAWLGVTGELGAVIGPLVGAALLGWGFVTVALSGAVFFVAIGVFLAVALPRSERASAADQGAAAQWWSLRDRAFVGFSALHAADLLAYNQLYLTLPLALVRLDTGALAVATMFAWASALTLLLQLPISRWCARVGPAVALRVGYTLTALGFVSGAVGVLSAADDSVRIASVFIAASLVVVGHLTTNPTALGLVPRFAGSLPTGSFFGLLATCGGIAVLLGNLIAGALSAVAPVATWVFLAVPPVVAAVLAPRLARRGLARDAAGAGFS